MGSRSAVWWEEVKFIAALAVILFSVMLSGCVLSTVRDLASMGQMPTAEQIEALRKAGQSVLLCVNVNGPPPNGGFTFLVIPGNSVPTINFAPNCSLIQGVIQ